MINIKIIIIIFIIISLCIIVYNYNENNINYNNNYKHKTIKNNNLIIEGFAPINAVELGSPGTIADPGSLPWKICNMTSDPNKIWAPNTKWIGGNANWIEPIVPINKKYYFQKKFNIDNINNLNRAEMFITSDRYCIVILNNLQISPSKIVNGLETGMAGGFNNSGKPNDDIANKITISKNKFKAGENDLICAIFKNPNKKPAGLLANLILIDNDNTKVTIKTDYTWLFNDIYMPQNEPLQTPLKVKSIKLINTYATDYITINGTNTGHPLQISQIAVYSMINGVETNITQLTGQDKPTVTASPNYPYPSNPTVITRTAQSAIDGNLKVKDFTIENGYHSSGNNDYWNLEFKNEYDIHKITYYNRDDSSPIRAQGVEVQLFNSTSTTPVYIYTLNSDLIQTINISRPQITTSPTPQITTSPTPQISPPPIPEIPTPSIPQITIKYKTKPTIPPLTETTSKQIATMQQNIITNLQTLLDRQKKIQNNNTDDYYNNPSPIPLFIPTTKESFSNTNEGSIMLNPESYPEVSDYADVYNQNIALLDDPRNMINASFNTYINIQDKKIGKLRTQLDKLQTDIQNNKYSFSGIKGFKSMNNSQILNVEDYYDPIYSPVTTNPNTTNPNSTNPNSTNPNSTNPNSTNPNSTNSNSSNPTTTTNSNSSNPTTTTNSNSSNPNSTNPTTTNPMTSKPTTKPFNSNINGSSQYPNYLIYGNNGCLQYEQLTSKTDADNNGKTVLTPATWAFKPCNANDPRQQFVSTQVNDLPTYNSFITDPYNITSQLNSTKTTTFGFNVVNPINNQDQCLQLNNDGLSVMPCSLDFEQRFRPVYNTVLP
jgi:hypothetical protein